MKTKLNTILAAALLTIAGAASAQTTLGTGATAQSGIAIGPNAMQGDVAAGTLSPTQPAYTGGIAIGQGANASGKNIALGQGISAPQDGIEGFYSLTIGGYNSVTGSTDYRRIVGMADGVFSTDGATMNNVWAQAAQTLSQAGSYTDTSVANALQPVNSTLANHDQRITAAQSTADAAMSTATMAISTSTQALAIAQQTQAQVKVLTGRVDALDTRVSGLESRMDGFDRRVNAGVAVASAMNSAVAPSLAPGESALLGGVGSFRGQAALSMGIAHTNYAGQSFSAKVSASSIGTAFALGGAVKF